MQEIMINGKQLQANMILCLKSNKHLILFIHHTMTMNIFKNLKTNLRKQELMGKLINLYQYWGHIVVGI